MSDVYNHDKVGTSLYFRLQTNQSNCTVHHHLLADGSEVHTLIVHTSLLTGRAPVPRDVMNVAWA
jgi:hypothetical protein